MLDTYVESAKALHKAKKNYEKAKQEFTQTDPGYIDAAEGVWAAAKGIDNASKAFGNESFIPPEMAKAVDATLGQYQNWQDYGKATQDLGRNLSDYALTPSPALVDAMAKNAGQVMKSMGAILAGYGTVTGNPALIVAGTVIGLIGAYLLAPPDSLLRRIPEWLKDLFDFIPANTSPLVFDLDGDGLELSDLEQQPEHDGTEHKRQARIYFDHDGDGIRTNGTWVNSDDGLLALDRNGNGSIDTGRELFGNNTRLAGAQNAADGYAALREQDSNADGVIDHQDANWAQMRIWRDLNQDGTSQADELFALDDLQIDQIGLTVAEHSEEHWDGTVIQGRADFVIGGQAHSYSDVWLGQDPFHRELVEAVPVSAAAAALPGLQGSGAVRDLREAAMQSPQLLELLQRFMAATSAGERLALTEPIAEAWGNTSGMTTSYNYRNPATGEPLLYMFYRMDLDSADARLWAQRMGTLEQFYGRHLNGFLQSDPYYWSAGDRTYENFDEVIARGYIGTPGIGRAEALKGAWAGFTAGIHQELVTEVYARPLLDLVQVSIADGDAVTALDLRMFDTERALELVRACAAAGDAATVDFSALNAALASRFDADPAQGLTALLALCRAGGAELAEAGWDGLAQLEHSLRNTPHTVQVQAVLDEFHVEFADNSTIVVHDASHAAGYGGREIIFGSGADNGWPDSAFHGTGADNVVIGNDGNDTLSADRSERNWFDGGSGDDALYGGGGNDTLIGGTGADQLYGFDGSTTYVFEAGFGQDTLIDWGRAGEGVDVIRFKGISASDVTAQRDDLDLVLRRTGSDDTVRIQCFFMKERYALDAYEIERVQFADGAWSAADLRRKVLEGNDDAQTLLGYESPDQIDAKGGDDTISAAGGDDRVNGGGGNDTAEGGAGNDTLDGGAGDDILDGGAGDDALVGGAGDDTLHGDGPDNDMAGNDVLSGGAGADQLRGGAGSDRYRYRLGDGDDVIADVGTAADVDTLEFDAGVAPVDVRAVRRGSDLMVCVSGVGDLSAATVTVTGQFDEPSTAEARGIERIEFSDGTAWSNDDLRRLVLVPTAAADEISGFGGDDVVNGLAGDDTLSGEGGADTLDGGEGNDTLYGDALGNDLAGEGAGDVLRGGAGNDALYGATGADLLDGGGGDDQLAGGVGSDIYLLARDSGHDTIADAFRDDGDVNGIRFAADISADDVATLRNGADLVVAIRDGESGTAVASATVTDFFYAHFFQPEPQPTIDYLEFADGTRWDAAEIRRRVWAPTAGNDTIIGYSDNDTLYGAAGDDSIVGGRGADSLHGDAGDDSLVGDDGHDASQYRQSGVVTESFWYSLYGPGHDDVLDGGDGNDVLFGEVGNDILVGGAGTDQLYGGAGDDQLDGGANADRLFGGTGDDTYSVDVGADLVTENADEGTDTVRSSVTYALGANLENLALTGAGAINGTGNTLNNVLTGNVANNLLDGAAGADHMSGGGGDDTYVVDDAGDVVVELAGQGTDTVRSGVSWTLSENLESLALTGTAAINGTGNELANVLYSNAGNNTLNGAAGTDTASYSAAAAAVTVNLSVTTAQATGGGGTDTLVNIENLYGSNYNDVLTGNSGANVLNGRDGTDTVAGGAGNDIYVVDNAGDVVMENAGEGTDTVQSSVSYTLGSHLENLSFIGSAALNGNGNALNNVLTGNDGNNALSGGAGNDTLNGGAGADRLAGGAGNDTYVVDNAGDVISENAAEGIDTVQSSISLTLAMDVEGLTLVGTGAINGTGNAGDNLIKGNSGNNVLNGAAGIDILQGGSGIDSLTDTVGNSLLDGGVGDDTLVGGVGNDLLVGGIGNDTITSGTGADVILFNRGSGMDIVNASTGNDNTLSLGNGIKYADLLFKRNAKDLILQTGTSEQVTLKDWYAATGDQSVGILQMVIEGTTDYSAASASAINNKKIVQFDFDALVAQFDAARVANPALTSWTLASSLLSFHLGGSNTAAIGGDLAYQYAKSGSLSTISTTPAQALLASPQFGTANQNLQAMSALQDVSPRLI